MVKRVTAVMVATSLLERRPPALPSRSTEPARARTIEARPRPSSCDLELTRAVDPEYPGQREAEARRFVIRLAFVVPAAAAAGSNTVGISVES